MNRHGTLSKRGLSFLMASCHLLLFAAVWRAGEMPSIADDSPQSIELFNGKDFDGWYIYTAQTQYENPDIFQVVDGVIYVPGGRKKVGYFGGLITQKEYSNYRLTFEFKWGSHTYGRRKNKARDAGVMVHCVGPNGPGPWMTSYEFQVIEGGTGDLLVVEHPSKIDNAGKPLALTCRAPAKKIGNQPYFNPGAVLVELKGGERLNWWGREPEWKDTIGFRGPNDLEKPLGEWNRCEIIARGNTLEFYLNGKLVNRANDLSLVKGKILFQTEGAEVWYRNLELTSLAN